MKNSLRLPLTIPPIIGRLDITYQMVPLLNHKDSWNWIHSHYIMLVMFYNTSSNQLNFNFMPSMHSPLVEYVDYNVQDMSRLDNELIHLINNGYYIMINLDDYYIPDKSSFSATHFTHINFIYGYDRSDHSFDTIGFNYQRNFVAKKIGCSDIQKGYANSQYPNILIMRTRNSASCNFSIDALRNNIHDFVNPRKSIVEIPGYDPNVLFGFEAQNYLITHFDEILNGKENFDDRNLHILWEHKKCMHLKMKYLAEKKWVADGDYFVRAYEHFETESLVMRNKFMKYKITHKKETIMDIKQTLEEMFREERVVLLKCLDQIDDKKLQTEYPLDHGIIGQWSFEGNGKNATGKNHMVAHGRMIYVREVFCNKDHPVALLDGIDDWYSTADDDLFKGMSAVSCSVWVNLHTLPVNNCQLLDKPGNYRLNIGKDFGNVHFVVSTTNHKWYSAGTTASSLTNLTTGGWYHIVGVYDGSEVKLYINGLLSGTGSQKISGRIRMNTRSRLSLGRGFSKIYVDGCMSETRLYDRALSDEQILTLYNEYI